MFCERLGLQVASFFIFCFVFDVDDEDGMTIVLV